MREPRIDLPVWTLDATFDRVDRAFRDGRLSRAQWQAYQAVWLYSAFRFSSIAGWPIKVGHFMRTGEVARHAD